MTRDSKRPRATPGPRARRRALPDLNAGTALRLYAQMALIRSFENLVRELYASAELEGGMHLSVGEEAVAVGVCSALQESDMVTSTHRPHGHCLAMGVDPGRVMAELLGRVDGVCRGMGGSMHLADMPAGFFGANGVVGAGAPLACGAALSAKLRGTGGVTVCFFGDGGAQQGAVHEAMNLASVWRLPVVFVCENNGYAQTTPVSYHSSVARIADRAASYAMPGHRVDGLDVLAVRSTAAEAVARAAGGDGPTLIEAVAWRSFGHFEGDQQMYRPVQERSGFDAIDPLSRYGEVIVNRGLATETDLKAAASDSADQVRRALAFARASAFPDPIESLEHVYVSYGASH
jgi:acetoin:2,6-dichlorophenolindophenol oxidoreductase subunit alpha